MTGLDELSQWEWVWVNRPTGQSADNQYTDTNDRPTGKLTERQYTDIDNQKTSRIKYNS